MPSGNRQHFFDGVKAHSEIKLRAIESYLKPWAGKVGSRANVRRVWVVDGFAGAGIYLDGTHGSPAIALAEADAYRSLGRRSQMSCFFVESNANNHASLKRLVAAHPEVEVQLPPPRDFWTQIENVAQFVGSDPAFVFVDPFGLGDLKFVPLVTLCNRLPQIDLLVNLASPVARRLESNLAQLVDEAVGGPGWTLDTIGNVFCQRLMEQCRFLPPASLPVTGSFGDLKYELILAARHPDAYELWNDRIVLEAEKRLSAAGAPDPKAHRDDQIGEVRERLLNWSEQRTRWRRSDAIAWHCIDYWGESHTGTVKKAFGELVTSGVWKEVTPGRDLDSRVYSRA